MKLTALITEFANSLKELVEADAMERARRSVLRAFGIHAPGKPGRPPKMLAKVATTATSLPLVKKARKKPPRQLCPVPGCKNTAAPIFGMVCSKHKGVKKSLIKKYREARKAKKLGLKPPTRRKRTAKKAARKPTPKKTAKRRAANGARRLAAMPKPVTALPSATEPATTM